MVRPSCRAVALWKRREVARLLAVMAEGERRSLLTSCQQCYFTPFFNVIM